ISALSRRIAKYWPMAASLLMVQPLFWLKPCRNVSMMSRNDFGTIFPVGAVIGLSNLRIMCGDVLASAVISCHNYRRRCGDYGGLHPSGRRLGQTHLGWQTPVTPPLPG